LYEEESVACDGRIVDQSPAPQEEEGSGHGRLGSCSPTPPEHPQREEISVGEDRQHDQHVKEDLPCLLKEGKEFLSS